MNSNSVTIVDSGETNQSRIDCRFDDDDHLNNIHIDLFRLFLSNPIAERDFLDDTKCFFMIGLILDKNILNKRNNHQ